MFSSCKWGTEIDKKYLVSTGKWRAELNSELGPLPFIFELELIDSALHGRLHSSEGVVPFKTLLVEGDSLIALFGEWELHGLIAGAAFDSLYGVLSQKVLGDKYQIRASRGGQYKFISSSRKFGDPLPVQWILDGPDQCLLTFEQAGPDLFAYFSCEAVKPKGLSGIKDNNRILLSGINSTSVALVLASFESGAMKGELWTNGKMQSFEAKTPRP